MKRARILVLCSTEDEALMAYLEWLQVLKDELSKGVKWNTPNRRIETPYCIMNFVPVEEANRARYDYVLPETCNSETVLGIAIGE